MVVAVTGKISAVALDGRRGYIYWYNYKDRLIYRANIYTSVIDNDFYIATGN